MRIAALPWLALAAALFLPAAQAQEQEPAAVPALKARVTDLTGTLAPADAAAIEQKLAAFEKQKGSQIAVLIVPTTQPEVIEQYSIRVAEAWKLGRKGVDDGVLLVIAKNDRKLRLEVGRGLEGAIPDAIAKRVTTDIIAPHFRKGEFAAGIQAGLDSVVKIIDGEPLPAAATTARKSSSSIENIEYLLIIGFVMVFVIGSMLRSWLGTFGGSLAVGGITGTIAGLIAGLALVGGIVGVIAFIFSLFGGMSSRHGNSSGGWGMGSSGGGWSGGGSSDSFSSGGGDFGGGGASSDW